MGKKKSRYNRDSLKKRTEENYKNKDKGSSGGKRILDLSNYDDVNWFKPEKGRYELDIIPYIVGTNHHPQEREKGEPDYLLDIWVHRFIGISESSVLCLTKTYGKPCPICEELKILRETDATKDEIAAITPKRRCIYNLIDLDDEDKGIQLFEISHFKFEKELLDEAGESAKGGEIITFADLEDGKTIKCRGSEESFGGRDFIELKNFSFVDRESYEEDILDEVYPLDELLVIPTYQEVKNIFYGIEDEEEGTEEEGETEIAEEEKEKPSRTRGNRKRRSTKKEEDVEQEEEKSTKKSKGKCPEGHEFGNDCDKHKECSDCDIWNDCADEQDKEK